MLKSTILGLPLIVVTFSAFDFTTKHCWGDGNHGNISAEVNDGILEVTIQLDQPVSNPLGLTPTVELRRLGSTTPAAVVDAFWDGGRKWRGRIRVTKPGQYEFRIRTSGPVAAELDGTVDIDRPALNNALQVSADKTHLETIDGQPFFWLADTAWNGVLRSTDKQWTTYLDARKRQGFNVIQFVSTPWRGGRATLAKPPFDLTDGKLVAADPDSLATMDRKIREINARGMVAAPIMLWALLEDDPGEALSEEDAIGLAKYLRARWGAYRVVWMLGGDGRYPDKKRWDRIGHAVFPQSTRQGMMPQLATTHPSGLNWVGEAFADSAWLGFHGYQSGHGDGDAHLRKHLTGPWTDFPFDGHPRPVINLEPNYETHPAYQSKQPHTAQHVRRAAYWSLLLGPTAGVTYGHNAIWVWNHRPNQVAENHRFKVDAWSAGLESDGLRSMTLMKAFFQSGPWWRLRSANELVTASNDQASIADTVVAASTTRRDWLVAYSPTGRPIVLAPEALPAQAKAMWFNPRTGTRSPAERKGNTLEPPEPGSDWVLSAK